MDICLTLLTTIQYCLIYSGAQIIPALAIAALLAGSCVSLTHQFVVIIVVVLGTSLLYGAVRCSRHLVHSLPQLLNLSFLQGGGALFTAKRY